MALALLLWLLTAVVATIRFGTDTKFSDAERARLVGVGNKEAIAEKESTELTPYLNSLQVIVQKVLEVSLVVYLVHTQGIFTGIILSTAGLLLIPLSFRVGFLCSLSDKLREAVLPFATKVALGLKPILGWLRDRDISTTDSVLNSQDELLDLVKKSPGVLSAQELARLKASLEFDDKKVSDVMTPKSMIRAVESSETLGPLVLDELYKTGHSRFPVYEKDLDHVVGTLYLHDLLDMKKGSQVAQKAMQPRVFFIRQDKDLTHAFNGFIKSRHHLFVVVNEYRETVGLLSLEDVLEALLGAKIIDEFDAFDDLRSVAEDNPRSNNTPKQSKDI